MYCRKAFVTLLLCMSLTVKWKMFKNYLMQQDDPPVLFLPRNQKQVLETIELIKEL